MSRNGSQGRSDHGDETAKIFITNLSPTVPEEELRKDLEPRFEKYGRIKHLNVKKNKNGLYSFAFLEFYSAQDAAQAIREEDQTEVHGKVMKVRKDQQMQGCFNCKKTGHYARDCPLKDSNYNDSHRYNYSHRRHERRKSRSRSKERGRRRYSRQRGYSRDRSYSRSYSPRGRYYKRRHPRYSPSRRRNSRSRSYSRDRYHREQGRRRHRHRSPSGSRSSRSYH